MSHGYKNKLFGKKALGKKMGKRTPHCCEAVLKFSRYSYLLSNGTLENFKEAFLFRRHPVAERFFRPPQDLLRIPREDNRREPPLPWRC